MYIRYSIEYRKIIDYIVNININVKAFQAGFEDFTQMSW